MDQAPDIFAEKRHLGAAGDRLLRGSVMVGAAGLLVSLAIALLSPGGWQRFFFAYLTSFAFLLSIALGGLYLVILHHLTHSGWSVVVRRLAEAVSASLPFLALLFIPVLVGLQQLYPWARPDVLAHDPALQAKAVYLNPLFFTGRWVLYFLCWSGMARFFYRRSLLQDASGDLDLTRRMERRAAPAMVLFAFTLTFAAIDLLMSLQPHWFSTIFGVYYFAGGVVGIYALLILLAFALQRFGFLSHAITVEHYHDLGKLLFGFVIFWAYIAFSQYMLIWYANLPEETSWLARRQAHGWGWVGLVLVLGHFLLPFAALLSRTPKRRPKLLAGAAAWMLLMHWVDLYWVVVPATSPGSPLPHLLEPTLLVGLGAWFLAAIAFALRGERSLVPERDPRLAESLTFENA